MVARPDRRSLPLFLRLAAFFGEHPLLGAARAPSLLTPDLGGLLLFRRLGSFKLSLDLIQQDSSSQEAIERLRALLLAPDPDTGRPMVEQDASRGFIDLLPARARRADKLLINILLPNAQSPHVLEELFFFSG